MSAATAVEGINTRQAAAVQSAVTQYAAGAVEAGSAAAQAQSSATDNEKSGAHARTHCMIKKHTM